MLKNYFKTAFRNLWKTRGYSLLNISGLAIGIACAALIFLWVEDEFSFDHYFSNRNSLYKVKDRQTYNGTTFTFDATPGPLAGGMLAEVPGLKNTARAAWSRPILFSYGDKTIYETGMYVDSSFLSMFRLQFIEGQAAGALSQLHSLVITETMARHFFGTTGVLGKTLRVNNGQDYAISGVIKDLPKNVSFTFDWLSPMDAYIANNTWLKTWGSNGIQTYAEVMPNANIDAINRQLDGFVPSKSPGAIARMSIYPMNRWRLYDSFDNGKEVPGRIKYVRLFTLIAWIVLLIACINFMNLTTARSEQRAREIGVRKVLGADRTRLIGQFLGESLIMAFISALLAIVLIYLALPAFNGLVEKSLSVHLFQPLHIGALIAITLLCGLIAGVYPAFYLSSFNPSGVLKGLRLTSTGGAALIRKGLVILQFSVSVILIISTTIIYQQIQLAKDRDLGYKKEGLLTMRLKGTMKEHFTAIRNDLLRTGVVQNASLSTNVVLQMGSNSGGFAWEGKDPNKDVLITIESVSPEYISTMGMQLKEGRDFYPQADVDSNNIIINETLAKIINPKKNVVGQVLQYGQSKYTVVGVVKDFIYNNMYSSGAPLAFFSDLSNTQVMTLRIKADAGLAAALPRIEHLMKQVNPGYPFEYKFVDDTFNTLFTTETLIGKLAGVFATLAIIISCLGLFGLAAYTAERRTKEIAIRKTIGAGILRIAELLSADFVRLVALSCIIAFPVSWWMMHNWLQSFEYRIHIHWWIFVLAGVVAILIALLTVSFQVLKAAVANPIKGLRAQ